MYMGTLHHHLPAKITVVNWTTSYQVNLEWYIKLQDFSWIYSGTLTTSFKLNVQCYIDPPASSWNYSDTLNYELAAETTMVNWTTSYQMN